MNKTYKYTIASGASRDISFETGVARLAIANGDGVDGSTTVVMSEITKQQSGDLVSFIDGADAPFADFIVNIAAVQSGSGDPSSDNERPIIGFNAVNVSRYGKNLADYPYLIASGCVMQEDGSLYVERSATLSSKVVFTNSTKTNSQFTVTITIKNDETSSRGIYPRIWYTDGTRGDFDYAGGRLEFTTFTKTSDANKIVDKVDFSYGSSNNKSWFYIQIERGSTATAYEQYNGNTYNINWQSTAGTVYGGTLNVKTGVLTVTHANIASYDGETINEPWISSMDVYSAGATPTTGAQVIYPLTTPVTYQLTPVEVRSLLGLNNVWADCGSVNVRYFVQSTQPMIDYIDDKTIAYFDAEEDFSTSTISLVGATSTDVKNCLLANKNANIVIRVKRYSTILLYHLREYSPNYFADFASHANIFDAEGTKSMRIDYLRLDLTQETSDFTDDYIILPTS